MLKTDVRRPETIKEMMIHNIPKANTFLYFAYDSNILTYRMHMELPNAEFVAIARLTDYSLSFMRYDSFWGGPLPTVVPTANGHVWGVIWRLDKGDLDTLNELVGHIRGRYYVKYLEVLTRYMGSFVCRSYIQRRNPLPRTFREKITIEQDPSRSLKRVLLLGAFEHQFPKYYIKAIKRLKHNGDVGGFDLECLLRRYCSNELCRCTVPGSIPRAPLKLDLKKKPKEKKLFSK